MEYFISDSYWHFWNIFFSDRRIWQLFPLKYFFKKKRNKREIQTISEAVAPALPVVKLLFFGPR